MGSRYSDGVLYLGLKLDLGVSLNSETASTFTTFLFILFGEPEIRVR